MWGIVMCYKQIENCTVWQFKGIPEFNGGVMDRFFYNCGAGFTVIPDTEAFDCTFMHFFKECKAQDVLDYVASLEDVGFKKVYYYENDGNLFYQFRVPEGLLYVSLMKNTGVVRIILDRCKTAEAAGFGYADYEDLRGDTVFAQYSLHYDAMIKGTTCDCGMNYVYRLRDNSLIIIDGGEMEQSTDVAVADYLDFLHTLTGTKNGEKMRVSLWLCTHPHNDHTDFVSKLLRFHAGEISVERAVFSFCYSQNTRHSPSVHTAEQRLMEKYPDVEYLRLHAGNKFNIANAVIEVLVSSEDTVDVDDEDIIPGTNDTSVVFKITADGAQALFLADCAWVNGDVLRLNYSAETLNVDFLQVAHHGINDLHDVYESIKAKFALLPQCRMNMNTRFVENYTHLRKLYGENNILFANDATDIFSMKNGTVTHTQRAHIGTAYDGSEY